MDDTPSVTQIAYKQCTYVIHFCDGEVLFYSVDLLLQKLRDGSIRKAAAAEPAGTPAGGAAAKQARDGKQEGKRGQGASNKEAAARKRPKLGGHSSKGWLGDAD